MRVAWLQVMTTRPVLTILTLSVAVSSFLVGEGEAAAQYRHTHVAPHPGHYYPPPPPPPPRRVYVAPRPAPQPVRVVRPRLYIGAGAIATRLAGGNELGFERDGGGLSLYAGLDVGRNLGLEVGWFGAVQRAAGSSKLRGTSSDESELFSGLTADAKLYLLHGRARPYVQGGLGIYLLEQDNFEELVGAGFQAGGGLDVRLGRRLGVNVRALYRGMVLGDERDEEGEFVSAITGDASLAIFF